MSLYPSRRIAERLLHRAGGRRVAPAGPADWPEEDGFLRARVRQANAETVVPVFDALLEAQIERLIVDYEANAGWSIPPAIRCQQPPSEVWGSTKPERLAAVLWILERLPAADSWPAAANQVACVLARVERLAFERARPLFPVARLELRPMRLVRPQPESVEGISLRVSYGIRHVTLFSETGAIQVQALPPENLGALNYRQRSGMPGISLLAKPDTHGVGLWRAQSPSGPTRLGEGDLPR